MIADRYELVDVVGRGGQGMVYKAFDRWGDRSVAIKVLSEGSDAGIRERFLREARAIGAVHHPNILAIYDAGTQAETPYIVMELATAGALWHRVKAGPVDAETVRQVGIQIARALAAAHTANILHRDVKPANILATAPGNVDGAVFSNAEWWVKNGETAQRAFDDMMNR